VKERKKKREILVMKDWVCDDDEDEGGRETLGYLFERIWNYPL